MSSTDDNPDPRYFGVHEGVVVDNRDPEGLHRVSVCVPGLLPDDGGAWAFPMGLLGGGGPQRGQWDPPDKGAEVYVWFLNGDPDKVRYLPGHHGRGEEPTAVKSAKAAADGSGKIDASLQVKVIHETSEWNFVVDERGGHRRMYIQAKSLGENLGLGTALMIELDRENGVLALSGLGGIAIRSGGKISIAAPVIDIAGRRVTQGIDKPI